VKLTEEARNSGLAIGLDLASGEPMVPADAGIFDNYIVKKQIINSWYKERLSNSVMPLTIFVSAP
jgi:hypothetical protein